MPDATAGSDHQIDTTPTRQPRRKADIDEAMFAILDYLGDDDPDPEYLDQIRANKVIGDIIEQSGDCSQLVAKWVVHRLVQEGAFKVHPRTIGDVLIMSGFGLETSPDGTHWAADGTQVPDPTALVELSTPLNWDHVVLTPVWDVLDKLIEEMPADLRIAEERADGLGIHQDLNVPNNKAIETEHVPGTKKKPRIKMPWDDEGRKAADAFKKMRTHGKQTLAFFCVDYCMDNGMTCKASTLAKKLSQNRKEWDPDKKYGRGS